MITLPNFPGVTIVDDEPILIYQTLNPRDLKWNKFRIEFIKKNPFCSICKGKTSLQVHHIKPFHIWPELELDINNLIVLCEEKGLNCHLRFGHLNDWVSYNPLIQKLVYFYNNKPSGKNDSLFILR